jgi:hypothetical protein
LTKEQHTEKQDSHIFSFLKEIEQIISWANLAQNVAHLEHWKPSLALREYQLRHIKKCSFLTRVALRKGYNFG